MFCFWFNHFWTFSFLCIDPAICQTSYSFAYRIYLAFFCVYGIGLLIMNSLSFVFFVSYSHEILNILPELEK